MAVPPGPTAYFILVQAHFAFGFLKTLLDRPPTPNGADHLAKGGGVGSKHQEIGQLGGFPIVQLGHHAGLGHDARIGGHEAVDFLI